MGVVIIVMEYIPVNSRIEKKRMVVGFMELENTVTSFGEGSGKEKKEEIKTNYG